MTEAEAEQRIIIHAPFRVRCSFTLRILINLPSSNPDSDVVRPLPRASRTLLAGLSRMGLYQSNAYPSTSQSRASSSTRTAVAARRGINLDTTVSAIPTAPLPQKGRSLWRLSSPGLLARPLSSSNFRILVCFRSGSFVAMRHLLPIDDRLRHYWGGWIAVWRNWRVMATAAVV